ncbi:MAG: hypothetical protein ACKOQ7_10960 [Actinomycetota bacterium]
MLPTRGSCDNGAVLNALTSIAFIALLVFAVSWLDPRQPQWVSRDGSRFISYACRPDTGSAARWTRVHGRLRDGRVTLRQSFLARSQLSGQWWVVAVDRDESHAVFTLGPDDIVLVRTRRDSALDRALSPHVNG